MERPRVNISFNKEVVIVLRNEMYRRSTQKFQMITDSDFNKLDTAASNYRA